jgi:hypothetical protein
VPKHASNIKLEEDADDYTKCHLTYMLSSGEENGFSMKHVEEERFHNGLKSYLPSLRFLYLSLVTYPFMQMYLECQAHQVTGAHGA